MKNTVLLYDRQTYEKIGLPLEQYCSSLHPIQVLLNARKLMVTKPALLFKNNTQFLLRTVKRNFLYEEQSDGHTVLDLIQMYPDQAASILRDMAEHYFDERQLYCYSYQLLPLVYLLDRVEACPETVSVQIPKHISSRVKAFLQSLYHGMDLYMEDYLVTDPKDLSPLLHASAFYETGIRINNEKRFQQKFKNSEPGETCGSIFFLPVVFRTKLPKDCFSMDELSIYEDDYHFFPEKRTLSVEETKTWKHFIFPLLEDVFGYTGMISTTELYPYTFYQNPVASQTVHSHSSNQKQFEKKIPEDLSSKKWRYFDSLYLS